MLIYYTLSHFGTLKDIVHTLCHRLVFLYGKVGVCI